MQSVVDRNTVGRRMTIHTHTHKHTYISANMQLNSQHLCIHTFACAFFFLKLNNSYQTASWMTTNTVTETQVTLATL